MESIDVDRHQRGTREDLAGSGRCRALATVDGADEPAGTPGRWRVRGRQPDARQAAEAARAGVAGPFPLPPDRAGEKSSNAPAATVFRAQVTLRGPARERVAGRSDHHD